MDQQYKDDGRPNSLHRFPVTDSLEFSHLVFANRLQNSPSLSLPHKLVIQLFFLRLISQMLRKKTAMAQIYP